MSDDKDKNSAPAHPDEELHDSDELVQIFKRGAKFTEELLKENERLRYRLAEIELKTGEPHEEKAVEPPQDETLIKELVEKVGRLEKDRAKILERFAEVEAENRDFANRYVEVEAENNKLLNLYIASYQLHSTLEFQEVLQTITEIMLNFVGAEVFAVAMLDEDSQRLRPLVLEGIEESIIRGLPMHRDNLISKVATSGESFFAAEIDGHRDIHPEEPLACIPLRIKNRVLGVVLLYRFLQQKTILDGVDHELFTLLAGHAATAIFASKLYTDSTRKLKTIQGLIDLVTS